MTNEQFDCCLTHRSGAASEAAPLVLVEGLTVEEAKARTKLAESTIRNASGDTSVIEQRKAVIEPLAKSLLARLGGR
ncbi:hypothetical protein [Crenobacter cavernae]|uniref:Uncharacterized protein n=1 Tax=Crenobacter cavernae TaxID=2290923 RepID=A0A345Y3L6_9NEIS|nr:hypothetical protein [Crenobacter cavernae]AXK38518.1 hypothetical protein DWG20_03245 [Crenobacter cavernae]